MRRITLIFLFMFTFAAFLGTEAQVSPENPEVKKEMAAKSNTKPLAVGAIAPDWSLKDQNGRTIKLSDTKSPVVLVFYRGYW